MEYLSNTTDINQIKPSVVVIGNFDGVHIGHQKLFEVAKLHTPKLQLIALSFCPHPTQVLHSKPKQIVLNRQDKINKIKSLGVDLYIEYPFTLDFSKTSAKEFVEEILINQLKAKVIVVGADYKFGKEKCGNIQNLEELAGAKDVQLQVVDEVLMDGKRVSSSLIREMLLEGEIEQVNKMLGNSYVISGEVIEGKKIGRQIGFPTANIMSQEGTIYPPNGVYFTKVKVYNREYLGITNIGYNPTVGGTHKTIETNIIDFDEDIYGQHIEVMFYKYSRPEKTFANLDELIRQITSDKQDAITFNAK